MARDPYFDSMPERQVLVWAAAVRRGLERWEPLVAKFNLMTLQPNLTPPPDPLITMSTHEMWEGETEHHFLMVAAGDLLKALALLDSPPTLDPIVAAELKEMRDLAEHWDQNMPVFNVGPTRPRAPGYPSGKAFAQRNPRHGPYCWWAWESNVGPMVSPNVTATALHDLVEVAIASCSASRPELVAEIPTALPRPWKIPSAEGDWWWPTPGPAA